MIQRGSHISLVFMQVLFPGRIGIWKCWFLWREEKWLTRREALGARREGTTNTTHIRHRAESNPGHIGGRRALSSLPHPCSQPPDYLCNFVLELFICCVLCTLKKHAAQPRSQELFAGLLSGWERACAQTNESTCYIGT